MRNEEAEENEEYQEAEKRSEHGTDLRDPVDIIEEYMQTLMLLVERQPAVAPKVMRLLVLSLSLENEGLAQRSLEQLLDLLEAGSIGEMVVETVMATMLPQLTDTKIPARARDLLLRALHTLAEEGDGIKQAAADINPFVEAAKAAGEPASGDQAHIRATKAEQSLEIARQQALEFMNQVRSLACFVCVCGLYACGRVRVLACVRVGAACHLSPISRCVPVSRRRSRSRISSSRCSARRHTSPRTSCTSSSSSFLCCSTRMRRRTTPSPSPSTGRSSSTSVARPPSPPSSRASPPSSPAA